MRGQPKGIPWLVLAMLTATFAMLGVGATSLSAPSLPLTPTYAPVIKVVGKVYCYRCFNEAHPEESHGKEHLKGAMVKVTCQANDQALVGFGYTQDNGKYSVTINGLPLSSSYGADSCKVELHSAPGGSDCNVPIELNLSGLGVHSKSNKEVVLQANQVMAFASQKTFGFCSKPHIPPPSPYQYPSPPFSYKSPPSPNQFPQPPFNYKFPPPSYQYPSPPFKYKSPPLPNQFSPPPLNKFPPPSYQYPSPPQSYHSPPPFQYQAPPTSYNYPPPSYGYKSPIPPTNKYLPPPYYFNSPPPQYQISPPANGYVSPPLPHQYPPPPYKSPLVPSSSIPPYYYDSPPPNHYSPPPYNYGSSPPTYQYSPPLPLTTPKHLPPKVPHEISPPALLTSGQPMVHHSPPPPLQHADMSSTSPSVNSYQSPQPDQASAE
uniref:Extensin domain-containing protein n=1 Tax=Leersia perrieri TaxID=77586 RepID=A0A0D9V927_9ORYZ